MRRWIASASALGALLLSVAASAQGVSTNIKDYVGERLDDFTATVTVVKADQRELSKISRDIGMAYRFKNMTMKYKEPNRAWMEGAAEGTKVTFILNGTKQIVKLQGRTVSVKDQGDSPGKRKSLMDVGLLSDFYLSYTNAKFLREGTVEGTKVAVFDMTYKDRDEDTSHHIIYIDPATKVVRKRESYSQEGKLQAIYHFKDIEQVKPGVWFPTRVEAQNTDRVIAGVMAYKSIAVNTNIPDSVFKP
jgi:outer membrane lipoprotein-sorting protein